MKPPKKCPLCHKFLNIDYNADLYYCNTEVILPNNKSYYHYTGRLFYKCIRVMILPFKVFIDKDKTLIYHLNKKAKPTAVAQFKRIGVVKSLEIISSEQILNKLKLITLFL